MPIACPHWIEVQMLTLSIKSISRPVYRLFKCQNYSDLFKALLLTISDFLKINGVLDVFSTAF